MKTIGLALVLGAVACGSGGKEADAGAAAGPGTEAKPQAVTVRLLGLRASGPVRVRVAAIELSVDGRALPAEVGGGEIDLGNDRQAWQVTAFDLPADAQKVAITLRLQPEGVVERSGRSQLLDLRGPPLTWVADAAQTRARGHVVLELDLARSLIDRCEQVYLLPEFVVRY